MKLLIQKALRKIGYQLAKYPKPDPDLVRRLKIMNTFNIDTLFDIGANTGQYAIEMRKFGYKGKIISFEPIKNVCNDLTNNSIKDKNWIVFNYAFGDANESGFINIAGNSFSSSILNMLPEHLRSAPGSRYTAKEGIEIKTLDTVFNSLCSSEDCVMIKIDTQGYEKKVIDGAMESLKKIKIIQIELSLVALYEKQLLFNEMINYLENMEFKLYSLENGFSDLKTGQLLQVDGVFVNNKYL